MGYNQGKKDADMGTKYSLPTDQNRLIKILKLDRYQYSPNSLLNELMEEQEDYDTAGLHSILAYLFSYKG